MYKYSIIMPVYNAEKFLNRSIESVVNQTINDWELIIVDDGSTDNSEKIIKKYANNYNNIKYFYQENKGPGEARNNAISKCNGSYICFLDADDYLEYDFLSSINEKLLDKEYDVIFYGVFVEREDQTLEKLVKYNEFENFSKNNLIKSMIMGNLSWGVYNKVVKRNIIKKCIFSELPVGEEIIFTFNVIYNTNSIGYLNKGLYHHIFNRNGQHKKGGDDPWKPVLMTIKKHLLKLNVEQDYYQYLIVLAVKACIISIYRCFLNYKYHVALNKIKEKVEYYNNEYNIFKVNTKMLSRTNKILFWLLKHNLYFILYIATKIRNKK